MVAAAAAAVCAVEFGHLSHFTWWTTLQFYGYAVLKCMGWGARYELTYMIQAAFVVVSVVAMSGLHCTVLTDAAEQYGYWYMPLNFGIHYLPLLIAIAGREVHPNPLGQSALAVGWIALYVFRLDAAHVYGCTVAPGAVRVVALLCVAPLVAAAFTSLCCLGGQRRDPTLYFAVGGTARHGSNHRDAY